MTSEFIERPVTHEIIERPANPPQGRVRIDSHLLSDLIATAHNGKAVRVPLNGKTYQRMRANFKNALWLRDYLLSSFQDGDAIVMWTRRRPSLPELSHV